MRENKYMLTLTVGMILISIASSFPVFAEASASASSSAGGSISITTSVSEAEIDTSETVEGHESGDTAMKVQLFDKYSDIISALESGEYLNAIEMIDKMRPEVQEGMTDFTLENWNQFYEFVPSTFSYEVDAYGAIQKEFVGIKVQLKPEYDGKYVELDAEVGYTYKLKLYHVTTVNPEDGSYELEEVDIANCPEGLSYFLDELDRSESPEALEGATLQGYGCFINKTTGESSGENIIVADAEQYDQYVLYPSDIEVVRAEGTIKVM